jgi:hypothetical protein
MTSGPLSAFAATTFFNPSQNLRIRSWNAATGVIVTVAGLSVGDDNIVRPFVYTHTPNTDRSAKSEIFVLQACGLLSCQVFASLGTPVRGQTFVRVELVQGREGAVQSLATLIQGYLTANLTRSYPGSPVEDALTGPGVLRSVAGTDPAAGIECSDTVPTGARWRLVNARFTLVTSATVVNRFVSIVLDDGVTTFYQAPDNTAHVNGVTVSHSFGDALGAFGTTAVAYLGPLPRAPMLLAGWRIRTTTQGLDAGDNYAAPQYLVEEWLEV